MYILFAVVYNCRVVLSKDRGFKSGQQGFKGR